MSFDDVEDAIGQYLYQFSTYDDLDDASNRIRDAIDRRKRMRIESMEAAMGEDL